MNTALFIAYVAGVAAALVLACFGDNLYVLGLVVAVYAFTHLMLREIDRKEKSK